MSLETPLKIRMLQRKPHPLPPDPVVAEFRRKMRRPCYAAARRRDWERLTQTRRLIDGVLPMRHKALNPSMNQANCCEFAIRRISLFSQIAASPTKENRTTLAPKTTPRRRSLGYWSALAAATIAVKGNGGGAKQEIIRAIRECRCMCFFK